ncbi:hypothetical protein JAAARDRAFT_189437 [Jaapia argillacea MUCL 33604]|uniref:F-box domain-containing protein n=1 Tax=Jaapia argillacea MUCL 33604 TaxID=933084 RepID=A0A067QEY3_9AGAM|nr:hypothetical protein JAAARDRAFT_189437 [Jaapia argillacea MUCL 33604]
MHRCLAVSDITTEIFQSLDGYEPTLAALARTCQTFRAPALDVLWRAHDGLTELVKCLSPSSWMELHTTNANGRVNSILKRRRSLTPSDFTRFDYYAVRVKILRLPGKKVYPGFRRPYPIDNELFHALSRCRPNHILFPSLLNLEWSYSVHSSPQSTIPPIHMFLSPSIKQFSLLSWWPNPEEGAITFLQSLRDSSPSIETLTLPRKSSINVRKQLISQIYQFPHLRHLDIGFEIISPEEIVHLATLPNLEGLQLSLSNNFTTHHLQSQTLLFPDAFTEHKPFAVLRSLRIGGTDLATCTALLSWISPCALTEVSFISHPPPSPALLHQNLAILSTACSPSSLLSLQIHASVTNDIPRDEDIHSRTINSASLLPLLAFCSLERVQLTTGCLIALDDPILEKLAAAWPRLSHLDFGTSPETVHVTSVTLAGLIPLAKHCPCLNHLSIILHASTEAMETRIEGTFPGHPLESLNLGKSTIVTSGSPLIADILFHLFPKLKKLVVWNDISDEGEAWEMCQAWALVWTGYDRRSGGHLSVYDEEL